MTALPSAQPPYGPSFETTADRQDRIMARHLKTLVIDDNDFDRKRLARLCADTGMTFDITELSSAKTLRAALDSTRFDLALIDFQLADTNGLDVVRRMRRHPAHVTCAILMLTGHADLSVAVKAMQAGCADYIEKSELSHAALRRAISNALEKADLQTELMSARGINDKLSCMVEDFTGDSLAEMKTILGDMTRRTRARLARPTGTPAPEDVELDAACRRLWSVIQSMEKGLAQR